MCCTMSQGSSSFRSYSVGVSKLSQNSLQPVEKAVASVVDNTILYLGYAATGIETDC